MQARRRAGGEDDSGTDGMAGLTTHILDTHGGVPAAGVAITLRRVTDGKAETLATTVTNADGRTDAPLLTPEATQPGLYEIDFAIGPYFRGRGVALPEPAFLETVTVRFGIADTSRHWHVPLNCSPYCYTTYRGS
jgi:5-hydroxyisourate hydrolase